MVEKGRLFLFAIGVSLPFGYLTDVSAIVCTCSQSFVSSWIRDLSVILFFLSCQFLEFIQAADFFGVESQWCGGCIANGSQVIALGVNFRLEVCFVLEGIEVNFTGVECFIGEVVGIECHNFNVDACIFIIEYFLDSFPYISGSADADFDDFLAS